MPSEHTFHVTVVTPEAQVLDRQADLAVLPAHDGEIGIMVNRAPLLCKLGVGVLRVEGPDGRDLLAIDGGFAECVDNQVTVLTEQAWRPEGLMPTQIQDELQAARQMRITDEASAEARRRAIERAKAKSRILAAH